MEVRYGWCQTFDIRESASLEQAGSVQVVMLRCIGDAVGHWEVVKGKELEWRLNTSGGQTLTEHGSLLAGMSRRRPM